MASKTERAASRDDCMSACQFIAQRGPDVEALDNRKQDRSDRRQTGKAKDQRRREIRDWSE